MKRTRLSFAIVFMRLICLLLAIVLVPAASVTAFAMHLTGLYPEPLQDLYSLIQPAGQGGEAVPAEAVEDASVVNILLIGKDWSEDDSAARSDSMILCSVNRDTRQLVLTSVLRDLYVPIPGHGSNRINAAYAFGGAQLLKQTLEENLAITIDGTVEVDFGSFSQILDQLGGVTLELRQDEAEVINEKTGSALEEGRQTLTGEQALIYSRIRNLDADGDFSRTDRQRKVLSAVWASYKNCNLPTLLRTLGSLLPMIDTDMGNGKLISLAVSVFPILSDMEIVSHRIPEPGNCVDKTVDGMDVLVADMDKTRENLRQWLYGREAGTV